MAKDLNISLLYDFYGDLLTEKQQEVIELYYNEDLSLAEIASHSGISRQGVRDSIKRGEAQLLEFESRLGLARRFGDIRATVEEIEKNADEISRINERLMGSRELGERVGRIKTLAGSIQEL